MLYNKKVLYTSIKNYDISINTLYKNIHKMLFYILLQKVKGILFHCIVSHKFVYIGGKNSD